ncbi:MAG: transglutaminase [Halobacteriovoraceae bacterium]|jgi:predicted transglutaminase-like cysteine proteinase|nr:transglutaminase [Halobacteriovoraceae bacterium]
MLWLVLIINTLLSFTIQAQGISLEIQKVKALPTFYQDFCDRWPGECDLSGRSSVGYTKRIKELVNTVNTAVNTELHFQLDQLTYDREEFWNYPQDGRGDCEDNALEKRRRLVALGIPRGALRIMTAFHRELYYGHALLALETDQGTYILDQDNPKILLWNKINYIIEARETVNGRWERFFQDW